MIILSLKRVDEFDGVTDAEVVEFSIDGSVYEIDLSAESKRQLLRDLERYINAGRRVAARGSKKSAKKSSGGSHKPAVEQTINNDAIRDWARSVGKAVSDRGRIPRDVVDAFAAAHEPNSVSPAFSGA